MLWVLLLILLVAAITLRGAVVPGGLLGLLALILLVYLLFA